MPGAREDESVRRRVVPEAAGRSLWFAAAWTGIGAAVAAATLAIVAVAVVWMPASGASGHALSTVHAGLLTFLAALHGGVTVDGTAGQFLPLGMLIAVALLAWRAGTGLADAATRLGEQDPVRLSVAAAAQAASFAVACLLAVPFARLGTSSAPFVGVGVAALVVFGVAGGSGFVLASPLSDRCGALLPQFAARVARAAGAGLAVYVAFGALLVAGSLVVHHSRVEALSREVGGGWSSVPILLLGVLAAPNAVIAAISYLAGPGFALGSGTSVSAFGTAHGVLPAFPLLGAVPSGDGANPLTWVLIVAAPLLAGAAVARVAWRAGAMLPALRDAALASAAAGVAVVVLAWQGGGGIGTGRLATVGASPWQAGGAVCAELLVVASLCLGVAGAWRWMSARTAADDAGETDEPEEPILIPAVIATDDDPDEAGSLAG